MKKLSTYLFLILFSLQTSSWADDISDFEIEGVSIGDSLLDYFSEDEINNKKYFLFENKKWGAFLNFSSFKLYAAVHGCATNVAYVA